MHRILGVDFASNVLFVTRVGLARLRRKAEGHVGGFTVLADACATEGLSSFLIESTTALLSVSGFPRL